MRNLDAERNIVKIRDGISGDIHEIYYRLPTNQELAAYQNSSFSRRGGKVRARLGEMRLNAGKRIITGFKKGTFALGGKPFSNDPDDPDYRVDWVDILAGTAADVISVLAMTVFEGTAAVRDDAADDDGAENEEDPFAPLGA